MTGSVQQGKANPLPATPWHVFAADYRAGLASYEAAMTDADTPQARAARNASHDTHRAAYQVLLDYPVTDPHQLAEKGELLLAHCENDGEALGVLAVDALIVSEADQRATPRTAALATLAEAADHWVEVEALLMMGDPTDAQLDRLNASRDRIATEVAAIPAETMDGEGYKALILLRLERTALADDAGMSPASLALLQSLLADLTRRDAA